MFNWKARFRNKTFLISMLGAVVAFIYQMLGILGITVAISDDMIINLIGIVINILVAAGIVVNPTTEGIADYKQEV